MLRAQEIGLCKNTKCHSFQASDTILAQVPRSTWVADPQSMNRYDERMVSKKQQSRTWLFKRSKTWFFSQSRTSWGTKSIIVAWNKSDVTSAHPVKLCETLGFPMKEKIEISTGINMYPIPIPQNSPVIRASSFGTTTFRQEEHRWWDPSRDNTIWELLHSLAAFFL